jgi:hypothetical protein
MFEWETFWARSFRFPVISLFAMVSSESSNAVAGRGTGRGKVEENAPRVKRSRDRRRHCGHWLPLTHTGKPPPGMEQHVRPVPHCAQGQVVQPGGAK